MYSGTLLTVASRLNRGRVGQVTRPAKENHLPGRQMRLDSLPEIKVRDMGGWDAAIPFRMSAAMRTLGRMFSDVTVECRLLLVWSGVRPRRP